MEKNPLDYLYSILVQNSITSDSGSRKGFQGNKETAFIRPAQRKHQDALNRKFH